MKKCRHFRVQVERHVVAKLTLLETFAFLEPDERECLLLLCQGFTQREIAAAVQQTYLRTRKRLFLLRQKLRLLFRRWEATHEAL